METCLNFLEEVINCIYNITLFEIIPGITIWTVLFYSLLATALFTAYTRKG